MNIRTFAASHVGLVRENNEDSFLNSGDLLVVADGLGGQAAGEVASRLAVKTIGDALRGAIPDEQTLADSIEKANNAILREAREPGHHDMGTTVVAAWFDVAGRVAYVSHVGDSRCYHHSGATRILTRDHSHDRHVLTRCLGARPPASTKPDPLSVDLTPGDRFLLCSDGLHGEVGHAAIESILAGAPSPERACASLIEAALRGGGNDNVTVAVAFVE